MDKPRGDDVISKVFQGTMEKLKIERSNMRRIIIFCKTYDNVISIYQFFKHSLEEYFTDPKGAPNHIINRVVDMYTHCTYESLAGPYLPEVAVDRQSDRMNDTRTTVTLLRMRAEG